MVIHIVFFKIKPELNKQLVIEELKQRLLALPNHITTLEHLEVGEDFNHSEAAYDLALYTTFNNKAGLNTYQAHPEHEKVKAYIGQVTSKRAVVDYEL